MPFTSNILSPQHRQSLKKKAKKKWSSSDREHITQKQEYIDKYLPNGFLKGLLSLSVYVFVPVSLSVCVFVCVFLCVIGLKIGGSAPESLGCLARKCDGFFSISFIALIRYSDSDEKWLSLFHVLLLIDLISP
jgi:hypothetical protein